MRAFALMFCVGFMLSGCATDATDPTFNSINQPAAPSGYARVYIFRDRVLYLAQAPYVEKAQITIDGHVFGNLANGSYLIANVASGPHSLIASSGSYQTAMTFVAAPSGDGFIEISDRTRMEGARMAVEGAVGALAARNNAVQAGEGRYQTRQDEINGAANAISQDQSFSGADRVWAISFPAESDALPRLQSLAQAN
jgi:hypothetical protein